MLDKDKTKPVSIILNVKDQQLTCEAGIHVTANMTLVV